MKNKILAIIGGTVGLFGLGYLIYVVLGLNEFNESASNVFNKLDYTFIIIMEVLYATLLTIIFSQWAQIKTFSAGLKAGLVIGAFIGACSMLMLFATSDLIALTGVIMSAVTFGVRFAVAGGIVGWFLGKD
jgi:hypothetical protein